ncbi:hypothetical protein MtrunA17_Chr5g0399631 [Medicago truncatula]|uniref:Transmembrane protein n=1 Tax=Medicago truncatula TaxID=3880 RepID=A0A396HSU1_MEDTR|nr:hypothetical protein MtrunA17_Chr5g0399631 [Medicago truncatula]
MGNHLSCIVNNDAFCRTFQIYVLDFELGKWSLYHEMGPFDFPTACGHEIHILCVVFCFWINHQIILRVSLLKRRNTSVTSRETMHFSYNVKIKRLTKIDNIVVGDIKVWLHTNSLVSLPSTPL